MELITVVVKVLFGLELLRTTQNLGQVACDLLEFRTECHTNMNLEPYRNTLLIGDVFDPHYF
jgi:hypothetical protein